jgi:hypothetical protein
MYASLTPEKQMTLEDVGEYVTETNYMSLLEASAPRSLEDDIEVKIIDGVKYSCSKSGGWCDRGIEPIYWELDLAALLSGGKALKDAYWLYKNSKLLLENPLDGTIYSDKVLRQMKEDKYHSFPESVDGFAGGGKVTMKPGGDGVPRKFIELEGSYMGKEGVFEWIIESNNTIFHRLFRPKYIFLINNDTAYFFLNSVFFTAFYYFLKQPISRIFAVFFYQYFTSLIFIPNLYSTFFHTHSCIFNHFINKQRIFRYYIHFTLPFKIEYNPNSKSYKNQAER